MAPTDSARNLLLLRASEILSVTTTTADVADAVRELRGIVLDASHLHFVLAGGSSDPLAERAIGERRTFYFTDGADLAVAFPGQANPDSQAAACVPVVGSAGVLGALHLRWTAPRRFFVAERAVIATLAAYIARALERAQRLEARIGVADTLQDAILSRLPAVERYELAALYLPADRQEKVGGDWYDVVAGRGSQLTLAIGDVVGHDMAAAARMGQLRSMLRAYIVDRHEPPSALLRRLDTANHALGEPIVATAVVAVLDNLPHGGYRLRWSNAGHPPPVVIHPDKTVESLTGNDLLLGARRFARRHTWTTPLACGSTVLLHTDGLIERAGGTDNIDASQLHLHRRLHTCRQARLQDLLEDAVADVGTDRTDDIAMLAVRLPPDA
ncbi:PP2C family protein-serine/threonine phosphatase [Actinoplanes sp. ATCC 53533]|uniref:PP2C family protein-serine/threonine phosphatase n=1 Tax=Actinoplanes sp. ATCC 53533 TaxID=1288362 RepID=UPI001F37309D|nr:SpoIIE family protein phosphatase [Actinoplanes sp. ATCC 53533]